MKNYFPFLFLMISTLFAFQCEKLTDSPSSRVEIIDFSCTDDPTTCELTSNNGFFAIDLFKEINENEAANENIGYPSSVGRR